MTKSARPSGAALACCNRCLRVAHRYKSKGAAERPGAPVDGQLRKAATELMRGHDFTAKPTIDPSVLQNIMPRDGNAALTVSGPGTAC